MTTTTVNNTSDNTESPETKISNLKAIRNCAFWEINIPETDSSHERTVANIWECAPVSPEGREKLALLFAASPELLDALQEVVHVAEQSGLCVFEDSTPNWVKQSRHAIAKATGQSI